jgi:hypothetical protein
MPNWILPMLALIALLAFLYFAFLHKPLARRSGDLTEYDGSLPPGDHT